jgi:hypothetical protein
VDGESSSVMPFGLCFCVDGSSAYYVMLCYVRFLMYAVFCCCVAVFLQRKSSYVFGMDSDVRDGFK